MGRHHGPLLLGLIAALALIACGPRHLSVLGNPGDYCTERTACTDGTTCRETEDGYRCMGTAEADRATKARNAPPTEEDNFTVDDDENLGPLPEQESPPQEEGPGEMDFGEEEGEDRYVPPSRRRRGRGRR